MYYEYVHALLLHDYSLPSLHESTFLTHVDRAMDQLDASDQSKFNLNSPTSNITAGMHPMGIALRGGKTRKLKPIDMYNIANCGLNAYCALRSIPKVEIRDGKQVLDIIKRIGWITTQNYSHYVDSKEIDEAIKDMALMGEDLGLPNIYVAPSSAGHFCYTKSGVKLNGSLAISKEVLVEGKPIRKVSSRV